MDHLNISLYRDVYNFVYPHINSIVYRWSGREISSYTMDSIRCEIEQIKSTVKALYGIDECTLDRIIKKCEDDINLKEI